MAMDMLKRSLELLGGSAVSKGKDYFSNAVQLADDAKLIGSEIKGTIRKPIDFVREMLNRSRGGGVYKIVSDWFYQRNAEYDQYSLDNNDDDFDAGFNDDGMDQGESSSPSLTVDSMKDIARGQVGAMYQIGQKQVEASLANTSEIVTTFNSRSMEIVASINNLNKSILNINNNLTKITAAFVTPGARNDLYTNESDPYHNGNLTLGSFWNSVKNSNVGTWASWIGTMASQIATEGPSGITDAIIEKAVNSIKINDRTLRERAEAINTRIGDAIQDVFSNLMANETFQGIFGNLADVSNDFSRFTRSDYNKEKAVFDGMTRKTIIEIIPEYLKKITESITGITYNIDYKGKLTTDKIDYVGSTITGTLTRSAFNRELISNSERITFGEAQGVNNKAISQILDWLTQGFVAWIYNPANDDGRNITLSMLDSAEYRDYAIAYAWSFYSSLYGENHIDSESFAVLCSQILDSQFFDNKNKREFIRKIQNIVNDFERTNIRLAQQGHNPGRYNNERFQDILSEYYAARDIYSDIDATRKQEIDQIIDMKYANKRSDAYLLLKKESEKRGISIESQIQAEKEEAYEREKTSARLERTSSNSPNGNNITTIVNDIRNHLMTGITKVEVVNMPGYEEEEQVLFHGIDGPLITTSGIVGSGGNNSHLNLNLHGCGPIALTDLANRMYRSGRYNPYGGTSVGNLINEANDLGINLYPGKLTRGALDGINGPITVMGSGYGYGTHKGQNHFMNIVGYDGDNVYTSNPMYGNGKYPTNVILNNTLLGLYGSGDGDTPLDELIVEGAEELGGVAGEHFKKMDKNSLGAKLLMALGVTSAKIDEKTGKVVEKINDTSGRFKGNKRKLNASFDAIGEYLKFKKTTISDDIHNALDARITNLNNRRALIDEGNAYADRRKETIYASGDLSDRDKQLSEEALSLMQAALADGDGGPDLSAIKKVINKIENKELRQSLSGDITGMINRSKERVEASPKSKIGKFILFGFGLIKKFLSPVFKAGKLLLTGIGKSIAGTFKFIKDNGKQFLKLIFAPYIRGFYQTTGGLRQLKESFFGYKEKNGDGTVTKHDGLVQEFLKPVKGAFNLLGKGIGKLIKPFEESIGLVGKVIKGSCHLIMTGVKGALKIGGKVLLTIGKSMLNAGEILVGGLTKLIGGVGSLVSTTFGLVGKLASPLWDKIKDSKFGKFMGKAGDVISSPFKGFLSGWRSTWGADNKGDEKVAKLFGEDPEEDKKPKNLTDQNTTTIVGLVETIVSIMRGEDPEANENEEEKKEQEAAEREEAGETSTIENAEENRIKEDNKIQEDEEKTNKSTEVTEDDKSIEGTGSKSNTSSDDKTTEDKSGTVSDKSNKTEKEENKTAVSQEENADDKTADTSKLSAPNNAKVDDKKSEVAAGEKKEGALFRIGSLVGKAVGGIGNIFAGVSKIVITAAAQLSGFKTLTKLVKSIITTAIKPINRLFKQIIKTIKPVIKTITSTLTQLVDSVVEILSTVLNTLTPFMEPLFNLVSDIFGAIGKDLVSLVTTVIKLLNPLVEFSLKLLLPLVKLIHGVLESALGGVMFLTGKMLYGFGQLIDYLDGFGASELAVGLMRKGNELAATGSEKFFMGSARFVDAVAPTNIQPVTTATTATTTHNTSSSSSSTVVNNDNSSTVVNNNNNSYSKFFTEHPEAIGMSTEAIIGQYGDAYVTDDLYGSGNSQINYGAFLNMKDHGCGPVALADNINRRRLGMLYGSGNYVDPRNLAVEMYNAGTYNANRGTSVRDYLTTGNALGYNMIPGGVDRRSLRQASPTNPITLVGSGSGFGTRFGNTHYINVVGTGTGGFSYVSNPLTGRVSKVSTDSLILNSKLGIYGSGETETESTSETKSAVSERIEELKLELDTGADKLKIGTNATTAAKYIQSKDSEYYRDIEETIADKYQHNSEKQQEYRAKKYAEWFIKNEPDINYMIFTDMANYATAGYIKSNSASTGTNTVTSNLDLSDVTDVDFSAEAIADRYSYSSTISTLIAGLKDLASNFLSIFNTDDLTTTEGQQKYLARLRKELGDETYNKIRAYAFIKFAQEHPPALYESLTPGTFGANTYAARFKLYEYNYVKKYKDAILKNPDFKPTASEVAAAGFPGISVNEALTRVYEILDLLDDDPLGVGTVEDYEGHNFSGGGSSWDEGTSGSTGYDAQGHITVTGMLSSKNAWTPNSKYATHKNTPNFIKLAQEKGLTPAEIATLLSTGVWEDGGTKLWGEKSLTATTYDIYGNPAVGLMNWGSGKHATTLEGELAEIKESYFNPGTHTRAAIVNNGFNKQDEEAYITATGRPGFTIGLNEKYGPLINTDLIEGSEHFYRMALVPGKIHEAWGVGENVGTAVGAYNWMIDQGYFKPTITSGTQYSGAYSTEFVPRLKVPENGNIYYNTTSAGGKNPLSQGNLVSKGKNILGNCAGYAMGRFHEMINDQSFSHLGNGTRNGGHILRADKNGAGYNEGLPIETGYNANIYPGDLISWKFFNNSGDEEYGHVAVVEKVKDKDNITISHSGYRKPGTTGGFEFETKDLTRGNKSDPWHIWNSSKGKYVFYGVGHNKYLQSQTGSSKSYPVAYSTNDYRESSPTEISVGTVKEGTTASIATQFAGDSKGNLVLLDQNNSTIGKVWAFGAHPNTNEVEAFTKNHPTAFKMSSKWQTPDHEYWLYDYSGGIVGAGDTPSTSSLYIPPIDTKNFLSDTLLNQDSAKSVNNYYIAKDSSIDKREELTALLSHTFNVRSESMEAILTEMLNEIKKRGNSKTVERVPSGNVPNLFDNDSIPAAIENLMLG